MAYATDENTPFQSVEELCSFLNADQQQYVERGLIRFANQMQHEASTIAEANPAGTLLYAYTNTSVRCIEITDIVKTAEDHGYPFAALLVRVCALMIRHCPDAAQSARNSISSLAWKIVTAHLKLLYKLLGADDDSIIQAPLMLLTAMAGFKPRIARELSRKFNFQSKAFLRIPLRHLTRHQLRKTVEGKESTLKDVSVESVTQSKADEHATVRSLFSQFVFAFLRHRDQEITTAVLRVRGLMGGVLAGLQYDEPQMVNGILTRLDRLVLQLHTLPSITKARFFSPYVVERLVNVYDSAYARSQSFVHAFLRNLTLPRYRSIGRTASGQRRTRWQLTAAQMPAVMRLVTRLKANEDNRQRLLTIAVLREVPQILEQFIVQLPYAFQPRPSCKWIANMSFLSQLYRLPFAKNSPVIQQIIDTPDAISSHVSTLIKSFIPSTLNKAILSQGLQHSNMLVKMLTLQTVSALLNRVGQCVHRLESLRLSRSGDASFLSLKQIAEMRTQVLHELRIVLPDVQVVFSLRAAFDPALATSKLDIRKRALLYQQAIATLYSYHRVVPNMVSEAHIDYWKLLYPCVVTMLCAMRGGDGDVANSTSQDEVVSEACSRDTLHNILRLLSTSSPADPRAFVYFKHAKNMAVSADDPRIQECQRISTNFGLLLVLYTSPGMPADMVNLLGGFAFRIMQSTGLFASRKGEVRHWLEALSTGTVHILESILLQALANPLASVTAAATAATATKRSATTTTTEMAIDSFDVSSVFASKSGNPSVLIYHALRQRALKKSRDQTTYWTCDLYISRAIISMLCWHESPAQFAALVRAESAKCQASFAEHKKSGSLTSTPTKKKSKSNSVPISTAVTATDNDALVAHGSLLDVVIMPLCSDLSKSIGLTASTESNSLSKPYIPEALAQIMHDMNPSMKLLRNKLTDQDKANIGLVEQIMQHTHQMLSNYDEAKHGSRHLILDRCSTLIVQQLRQFSPVSLHISLPIIANFCERVLESFSPLNDFAALFISADALLSTHDAKSGLFSLPCCVWSVMFNSTVLKNGDFSAYAPLQRFLLQLPANLLIFHGVLRIPALISQSGILALHETSFGATIQDILLRPLRGERASSGLLREYFLPAYTAKIRSVLDNYLRSGIQSRTHSVYIVRMLCSIILYATRLQVRPIRASRAQSVDQVQRFTDKMTVGIARALFPARVLPLHDASNVVTEMQLFYASSPTGWEQSDQILKWFGLPATNQDTETRQLASIVTGMIVELCRDSFLVLSRASRVVPSTLLSQQVIILRSLFRPYAVRLNLVTRLQLSDASDTTIRDLSNLVSSSTTSDAKADASDAAFGGKRRADGSAKSTASIRARPARSAMDADALERTVVQHAASALELVLRSSETLSELSGNSHALGVNVDVVWVSQYAMADATTSAELLHVLSCIFQGTSATADADISALPSQLPLNYLPFMNRALGVVLQWSGSSASSVSSSVSSVSPDVACKRDSDAKVRELSFAILDKLASLFRTSPDIVIDKLLEQMTAPRMAIGAMSRIGVHKWTETMSTTSARKPRRHHRNHNSGTTTNTTTTGNHRVHAATTPSFITSRQQNGGAAIGLAAPTTVPFALMSSELFASCFVNGNGQPSKSEARFHTAAQLLHDNPRLSTLYAQRFFELVPVSVQTGANIKTQRVLPLIELHMPVLVSFLRIQARWPNRVCSVEEEKLLSWLASDSLALLLGVVRTTAQGTGEWRAQGRIISLATQLFRLLFACGYFADSKPLKRLFKALISPLTETTAEPVTASVTSDTFAARKLLTEAHDDEKVRQLIIPNRLELFLWSSLMAQTFESSASDSSFDELRDRVFAAFVARSCNSLLKIELSSSADTEVKSAAPTNAFAARRAAQNYRTLTGVHRLQSSLLSILCSAFAAFSVAGGLPPTASEEASGTSRAYLPDLSDSYSAVHGPHFADALGTLLSSNRDIVQRVAEAAPAVPFHAHFAPKADQHIGQWSLMKTTYHDLCRQMVALALRQKFHHVIFARLCSRLIEAQYRLCNGELSQDPQHRSLLLTGRELVDLLSSHHASQLVGLLARFIFDNRLHRSVTRAQHGVTTTTSNTIATSVVSKSDSAISPFEKSDQYRQDRLAQQYDRMQLIASSMLRVLTFAAHYDIGEESNASSMLSMYWDPIEDKPISELTATVQTIYETLLCAYQGSATPLDRLLFRTITSLHVWLRQFGKEGQVFAQFPHHQIPWSGAAVKRYFKAIRRQFLTFAARQQQQQREQQQQQQQQQQQNKTTASSSDANASTTSVSIATADSSTWFCNNLHRTVLRRGVPSFLAQIQDRINNDNVQYDPFFVLPMLHSFLSETSTVDLRRVVVAGTLSYTIWAMAADSTVVRRMAYMVMARFFVLFDVDSQAQNNSHDTSEQHGGPVRYGKGGKRYSYGGGAATQRTRRFRGGGDSMLDFREKAQLLALLTAFKNTITEEFQQLPCVSASFVSSAIDIAMKPDHSMYKAVNRFVLRRPHLDFKDVPMFYNLFNSGNAASFRTDRLWLLRVVLDGFHTRMDHHVLQRRHTFAVLMSFFNSTIADNESRELVVQLFSRAVRQSTSVVDLVDNCGLTTWLRTVVAHPLFLVHLKSLDTVSTGSGSRGDAGTSSIDTLPALLQNTFSCYIRAKFSATDDDSSGTLIQQDEKQQVEHNGTDDNVNSHADDTMPDVAHRNLIEEGEHDDEEYIPDPAAVARRSLLWMNRQRSLIRQDIMLVVCQLSAHLHTICDRHTSWLEQCKRLEPASLGRASQLLHVIRQLTSLMMYKQLDAVSTPGHEQISIKSRYAAIPSQLSGITPRVLLSLLQIADQLMMAVTSSENDRDSSARSVAWDMRANVLAVLCAHFRFGSSLNSAGVSCTEEEDHEALFELTVWAIDYVAGRRANTLHRFMHWFSYTIENRAGFLQYALASPLRSRTFVAKLMSLHSPLAFQGSMYVAFAARGRGVSAVKHMYVDLVSMYNAVLFATVRAVTDTTAVASISNPESKLPHSIMQSYGHVWKAAVAQHLPSPELCFAIASGRDGASVSTEQTWALEYASLHLRSALFFATQMPLPRTKVVWTEFVAAVKSGGVCDNPPAVIDSLRCAIHDTPDTTQSSIASAILQQFHSQV
jgi:Nucleolar pre-ribosomal-associated protein 1/Ribosome 60S biogenesis N-terminal